MVLKPLVAIVLSGSVEENGQNGGQILLRFKAMANQTRMIGWKHRLGCAGCTRCLTVAPVQTLKRGLLGRLGVQRPVGLASEHVHLVP